MTDLIYYDSPEEPNRPHAPGTINVEDAHGRIVLISDGRVCTLCLHPWPCPDAPKGTP